MMTTSVIAHVGKGYSETLAAMMGIAKNATTRVQGAPDRRQQTVMTGPSMTPRVRHVTITVKRVGNLKTRPSATTAAPTRIYEGPLATAIAPTAA